MAESERVAKKPGPQIDTRKRILQAAAELFAEFGYHGTSLRQVAAKAGISHPGLLYQFPSKAELATAVLTNRHGESAAFIQQQLEQGEKDFFDIIVALSRLNAKRPEWVELYSVMNSSALPPDNPIREFFQNRADRIYKQGLAEFEKAKSEGRLAEGVDPAVATRTLITLYDGLQNQWLLTRNAPNEFDMAAHIEAYLKLVLPQRN